MRAALGVLAVVLVAGWLIAAVGGDEEVATEAASPAAASPAAQPGSPAVYRKIERSTNCADLQATFTRAADNNERYDPRHPLFDVTLGYMDAADARMRAVGCYG